LNTKSNTLFSVSQVKQKQQDLKKEYYNLNDLLAGSGFGWDNARMMVHAPASVWARFCCSQEHQGCSPFATIISRILML
jgi:hypothetical protein